MPLRIVRYKFPLQGLVETILAIVWGALAYLNALGPVTFVAGMVLLLVLLNCKPSFNNRR